MGLVSLLHYRSFWGFFKDMYLSRMIKWKYYIFLKHIDSRIFMLNKYKTFKIYSAHPIHKNSAPVSPIATIAIAFSVGGDFLF